MCALYMWLARQEIINDIGQGLCNSEARRRTCHCRELIADIREKAGTRHKVFELQFLIGRPPKSCDIVIHGLCEISNENPRQWNKLLHR
jgi:hypothetical protein